MDGSAAPDISLSVLSEELYDEYTVLPYRLMHL